MELPEPSNWSREGIEGSVDSSPKAVRVVYQTEQRYLLSGLECCPRLQLFPAGIPSGKSCRRGQHSKPDSKYRCSVWYTTRTALGLLSTLPSIPSLDQLLGSGSSITLLLDTTSRDLPTPTAFSLEQIKLESV